MAFGESNAQGTHWTQKYIKKI